MRLKVFLALAAALPLYGAETNPQPITHLAQPVAEPSDGAFYAPPSREALHEPPTPQDIGPVQKHFALASQTDDLAAQPDALTRYRPAKEPIALDKRVRVPLVHDVQNDSSFHATNNDSLSYELKYLNWGAVTSGQLLARQGQYFTITVDNDGPASDLTMCFEYRQVKSQQIVRKLVQEKHRVSGAVRAYFGVVNHAYLAYGPVSAWRFTVLRGDTIVAEAKSFLW